MLRPSLAQRKALIARPIRARPQRLARRHAPGDLAAQVIRAALDKIPALDPHTIDDLYLGSWEHTGEQSENMARRVAVLLGLDDVPAATVNRACASSVQTTRMAVNAIRAADGEVFISAGVECVSRYPKQTGIGVGDTRFHNRTFDDAQARTARRAQAEQPWVDPRTIGEVPDIYITMGQTAENVARHRGITRAEQDEFAYRSQQLAAKAIADGFFYLEITPVSLPTGVVVDTDDGPRPGTTVDILAHLPTVFREPGTVTAGNACPLNDGAAALVITSGTKAAELGIAPLARVVATGDSGLSPEIMGLGPVEASQRALAKAGLTITDIDLAEVNEAFAAQVIPAYQDLGIDPDRLNVNGGPSPSDTLRRHRRPYHHHPAPHPAGTR